MLDPVDALRETIADLLYAAADSRNPGEKAVLRALASGLGKILEMMEAVAFSEAAGF